MRPLSCILIQDSVGAIGFLCNRSVFLQFFTESHAIAIEPRPGILKTIPLSFSRLTQLLMLNLSEIFEESYYLQSHPDVAAAVDKNAFETALAHFIKYGQFEGRDPSSFFNTQYYLQQNPDVAAAVRETAGTQKPLTAIAHFIKCGQFEGRNPNPNFDTSSYLEQNPEIAAEVKAELVTAFESYLNDAQHNRHPSKSHPLDPLTRKEIRTAVKIIKETQGLNDSALFPRIFLQEPSKSEVLNFELGGGKPKRTAFVSVLDIQENKVYEATVDLGDRSVASWTEIPGVQPALLDSDFDTLSEVVKADPRWQAAMIARGITNFDDVIIDGWAPGALTPEETASGARLMRGLSYSLKGEDSNFYARPIEGVLVTVNLNTQSVTSFVDTGVVPIPEGNFGLDPDSVGTLRPELPPLVVKQPKGVGFEIDGNQISWENWQFRYSIDPRSGLVLHQVGYTDRGQVRPILYRASLSEMAVPYADASETWTFRNAFDVGEYDLGKLSNSLEPGQHVPDNSVLLDAVFADEFGKPYTAPDVVGIYERDSGVLWQHYDYATDTTELRRGRELVMSSIVTIGNYDYGLDWIFHQDGSIEVEAHLTGILLNRGTSATSNDELGEGEDSGALVAPNILAPSHQHFFNFRLDFDVNGTANSAIETNTLSVPVGPSNPGKNAFIAEETLLTTETAAQRDLNLLTNREWAIVNSSQTNALGGDIGYVLEPETNTVPFAAPDSSIRQRAGFVNHHVWVTQYKPNELYASGDYPSQAPPGQGLVDYSSNDESIVGQDVVLWYTLGLTHHPRPENFPVMSAEEIGFKIVPEGFFTQNPALDLPPSI
jgi:primary-amine oxidase